MSDQTLKTSKSRMYELDALRGIACIMVVLFHYSIRIDKNDSHYLVHYGYMGVDLFFIISGFVIYLTLERTRFWLDFVVHRFSRLFPAYWVAVSLTYLVLRYSTLNDGSMPLFYWIFNMTMLQHWIGIKDLDGAYWTLNLELSFYVLMFVLYLTKMFRNIYGIVLLLLVPCWANLLFPRNPTIVWLIDWIPVFRLSYLFAAGILFYKAYIAAGKYTRMDIFGLLLCLGTAWFGRGMQNLTEFLHVCLFFLTFWLFTKNKLKFIQKPFLIWLGGISYTLYLLHEVIGWELIKWLKMIGIENFYLSRTLVVAAMLLLSYLVSTILEKPAQKLINSSWKKISGRFFMPAIPVVAGK